MNFISIEFVFLLTTVLALVAIVRVPLWQKTVIFLASCVFYAYWDWRFLGLLILITIIDYYISVLLTKSEDQAKRKMLLVTSVTIKLVVLGFFKYFNFFVNSFNIAFMPFDISLPQLRILLPVGISFYTFETLSYVIDVYRGHTRPARSLLDYATFVAFFPRLVAGPIMRASHFLPQLERGVIFSRENFILGAQRFGQGVIKKVVVADTLAILTDKIYSTPWIFSSATVWVGVLAFSIQIYFDFSGYSDMATGVARLFGFELPVNFNLPFTSRNLAEFWQRWHISLSTWLRDYLYISLGGNRKGNARTYLNMFVTMLLGGLWHGASWNYVLWGGAHGAALGVDRALGHKIHSTEDWKLSRDWIKGVLIFIWIGLACVLFRSPSMYIAFQVSRKLLFIQPDGVQWIYLPAIIYTLIVLAGGFLMRAWKIDLAKIDIQQPYVVPMIVIEFVFAFLFSVDNTSPFIYFQF